MKMAIDIKVDSHEKTIFKVSKHKYDFLDI